jgi:hypothetical protein
MAGHRIVPLLLVATAWGCPGTLDDPARFLGADAGAADPEAAATADAGCPDIPALFATTCTASSCHSASNKAQGLDLQSPDLAARLVGVPATEGPGLLVDPSTPSQSVLCTKLQPDPPFGARMPLSAAPLDGATIACVLAWIEQTAEATHGDAGDGDGGAQ